MNRLSETPEPLIHKVVILEEGVNPEGAIVYTAVDGRKYFLQYEVTGNGFMSERRHLSALQAQGLIDMDIVAKFHEVGLTPDLPEPNGELDDLRFLLRYMLRTERYLDDEKLRFGAFDQRVIVDLNRMFHFGDMMSDPRIIPDLLTLLNESGDRSVKVPLKAFGTIMALKPYLEANGCIITFHESSEDRYGKKLPSIGEFNRKFGDVFRACIPDKGDYFKVHAGVSPHAAAKFRSIGSNSPNVVNKPVGFNPWKAKNMAVLTKSKGDKWEAPTNTTVIPMSDISLGMFAGVLHYADTSFEGFKAVRGEDGKMRIPNLEEGIDRLFRSMAAMGIKELPSKEIVRKMILNAIDANKDYIPADGQEVLYIRPVIFGAGEVIGVKHSGEYVLSVVVTPVAAYLGKKPVVIERSDKIRATEGGGQKSGANYPAMIANDEAAASRGRKALYVDEDGYVTEMNGANFFMVTEGPDDNVVLSTPSIKTDRTLPGNTRAAVLKIAKSLNEIDENLLNPSEPNRWKGKIDIDDEAKIDPNNISKIAKGLFLTGTAAGVVPVVGFADNEGVAMGEENDMDKDHPLIKDLIAIWDGIIGGSITDPRFAEFVVTYDAADSTFETVNGSSYDLDTGKIKEAS